MNVPYLLGDSCRILLKELGDLGPIFNWVAAAEMELVQAATVIHQLDLNLGLAIFADTMSCQQWGTQKMLAKKFSLRLSITMPRKITQQDSWYRI